MRRLLFCLLALAAAPASASPTPEVTINILARDAREPSSDPPRPQVAVRRFRIRIDARGVRSRSAELRAALAGEVAGRTVRVDGITLSTTPQVIAAEAPLAEPRSHALEVEGTDRSSSDVTIIWTAEVR